MSKINYAEQIGLRDGKDAYLLDREIKNPFPKESAEYHKYETYWELGYEEEDIKCQEY